jgi:hypothetical protein
MGEREIFCGERGSADICLDEHKGECLLTMIGCGEEQSTLSPDEALRLAEGLLAFAVSNGAGRANQAGEK